MLRALRSRVVAIAVLGLMTAACGITGGGPTIEPGPAFSCVGVPQATCQQTLQDARNNAQVGETVVALRIACTKVPCTDQEGEASVEVGYSSGRRDSYGMGWAGAAPAPAVPPDPAALPVEPDCGGVPQDMCLDFAREVASTVDPSTIASIVLRCQPGPCTATGGDGETTVTFTDGSTTTASWNYAGATAAP